VVRRALSTSTVFTPPVAMAAPPALGRGLGFFRLLAPAPWLPAARCCCPANAGRLTVTDVASRLCCRTSPPSPALPLASRSYPSRNATEPPSAAASAPAAIAPTRLLRAPCRRIPAVVAPVASPIILPSPPLLLPSRAAPPRPLLLDPRLVGENHGRLLAAILPSRACCFAAAAAAPPRYRSDR
jgi:hypothetical protein